MYSDLADVYHEIFPLNQSFLKFIPDYLGKPGTKVLDLGCGPGDYVNELSSVYDVTGIDLNAEMINLAKTRNKGTFYRLSFEQIDKLGIDYGCVYCIGNSLSYLPTDSMNIFFKTVSRLLRTSGYFILQVVNWDKYRLTGTVDFNVNTLSDGRTFHRRYEPSGKDAVLFKTELREDGEVSGAWSDSLYPKYMGALVSGLTASGMVVDEQFGNFEKKPFIPAASPATIVVARKPDTL
jgi:SAM-dependent methyltransferase